MSLPFSVTILPFSSYLCDGMDQDYLDILREWQRTIGRPAIYANLDHLFPEYAFQRRQKGTDRDHWASRYKLDLTLPRKRSAEKTVVYQGDMRFREQGEWDSSVDVLQKLMDDHGFTTVHEAFSYVDRMFDLGMPTPTSAEVNLYRSRRRRSRELLLEMKEYFQDALWDMSSRNAGRVRSYLSSVRGFPAEKSRALGFGFVPSWNDVIGHFTRKRGYSLEEIDSVCGVRSPEGKTAVGSVYTLAIPYESAGVLRGFLFRRVGEGDGPKYIANRDLDRKSAFFHISQDSAPKDIVVVEGEFDALTANARGVRDVVAIGGSELAGDRCAQVEDALSRRGVRRIVLCLDLDPAKDDPGQPNHEARYSHVMRSIHTIKDVDPSFEEIYVVRFPEISDPDEFLRKHGVGEFRKLLEAAVPYWEYVYDYNRARQK